MSLSQCILNSILSCFKIRVSFKIRHVTTASSFSAGSVWITSTVFSSFIEIV